VSVINQMLKDLDQRAPEQGQAPMPAIAGRNPSTLKVVLISVVVLLSLNALAFYILDLQDRAAKNIAMQEHKQTSQQKVSTQATQAKEQLLVKSNLKVKEQVPEQTTSIPVVVKQENAAQKLTLPVALPVKLPVQVSDTASLKETKIIIEKVAPKVVIAPKIAKMSVSRRQLTSKELVAQKLVRAEKAVNVNEITKAEQLFEEILIIEPKHKQARKKLAALWFGRKSYSQAVNLLSQGIALDRQDDELRLLKAKIHLSQGQHQAAFNTLKPLASLEQEEYQVTFANVAQKIEQYSGAISAYQVLIKMQPYSGRWHLGLAIVYDKNSQFPLAINEYALALTKADLSASSAKFAQQRMQALGE